MAAHRHLLLSTRADRTARTTAGEGIADVTDLNGDHRTKRVIRAQHIGASVRFATATLTRVRRVEEHQADDADDR